MIDFIKTAYCITLPVLVVFSWAGSHRWKKYCTNLVAVSNLVLIVYAVLLARQLIGLYLLEKQFTMGKYHLPTPDIYFAIRLWLVIFLPFLSLHTRVGKNSFFSLLLVALLYSLFPVHSWNSFDLPNKILNYFCLLCSGYALLWLLSRLPHQSPAE